MVQICYEMVPLGCLGSVSSWVHHALIVLCPDSSYIYIQASPISPQLR